MGWLDNKGKLAGGALIALAVLLGCTSGMQKTEPADQSASKPAETAPAETATAAAETPAPEKTGNLVAETGTGIVLTKSADWAEQYPNEFATYMQNDENEEVHSYLEHHPYLVTLYKG